MATKHTHQVVFGNRVAGCPRCTELTNGAPAIQWRGSLARQREAQRMHEIRTHDCRRSRCGPVCTAFDH